MKKNSGDNVVLGVGLNKPIGIKKLRIKQSFFNHDEEKPMAINDITELVGALTGLATVIAPVVVLYIKSRKNA